MSASRDIFALIVRPVTDAAVSAGYAIGVHGSLNRDIDFVAVPWTDAAVPPEELADIVRKTVENVTGVGIFKEVATPKPHGRLAWTILCGRTYVDLSVTPRLGKAGQQHHE